MSNEELFLGPIERHLLEKLKKEKIVEISEIYGAYSTRNQARGFINKVLSLEIATLEGPKPVLQIKEKR